MSPGKRSALVVVDLQSGFDDAAHWGPRNNPGCEKRVEALVAAWRQRDWPVVFIRHDSTEEGSPLRPESPGNAFNGVLAGEPDFLVAKSVHSAFYGEPDLHEWLEGRGIDRITVCGVQTNFCCETTARMGSDLGYEVDFVLDATYTFDLVGPDGERVTADELSWVTALNLAADFANVVTTGDLID